MKNYENLPKDELIKLLLSRDENDNKELEKQNKILLEENKILLTKNKEIQKKNEKLQKKYDRLEVKFKEQQIKLNELLKLNEERLNTIKKNNRDRFYTTSEKLDNTFEKEEIILNNFEAKEEKPKRGRKDSGKNFNNNPNIDLDSLETIVHDFSDDELKELEKKHKLIKFCEDIVVKLVKTPAVYKWVKVIRPKYKDPDTDEIFQVENTNAFSKAAVDSSIVADVINSKMNLGVPVERQSQYFKSLNFDLSAKNISNYMMRAADILTPIYDKMFEALINNQANVIHCDETPVQVLDNAKNNRKVSYMFVLTTSFWDNPIYIYDFNMTRETSNIEKRLKTYKGYLVVDGYKGYDKFKNKNSEYNLTGISLCWCHLRRYFADADISIYDNKDKKENRTESKAEHTVHLINKIFIKEAEFKENHLTKDQIKEKRNGKEYKALLDNVKSYIDSINPAEGTKLYKAVNYAKNNWNELLTITEYGGIDITNSIAERAVKPFAVARKSFLFCKSNDGARASGILFSIVQTAKANGLCVEKYLNYIFTNFSDKTAEELLPWSNKIPNDIKVKLIAKK